jgi:hypothetical protein
MYDVRISVYLRSMNGREKLPELVHQNSDTGPCLQFDDATALSNSETAPNVIDGHGSTKQKQCVHRNLIATQHTEHEHLKKNCTPESHRG